MRSFDDESLQVTILDVPVSVPGGKFVGSADKALVAQPYRPSAAFALQLSLHLATSRYRFRLLKMS